MTKFVTVSHANRATKEEAFNFVLNLKTAGYVPSETEIDLMLNYFSPPAPKAPKNAKQWVAAGVDLKDIRPYCHFIWVKDGVAISTNGYSLRAVKTDLAAGVYSPLNLLPVTTNQGRPDFERLIPKAHRNDFTILPPSALLASRLYPIKKTQKYAVEIEGIWFDKVQLEALIAGDEKPKIKVLKADKKLVGNTYFGDFVLMALNI